MMNSLSSEVSIGFKHQKIYAILDVLMGSSRNHVLTSRVLEPDNSFISIMEDAVLDSALIMDTHTVVTPSQDERSNVPKNHVVDSLPKFCPPRKGVSAIRSFPPGCGKGAPPVRIQDRSKCLQNVGSRTKSKQCLGASCKKTDKSSAASFSGNDLCKSRLQSPAIPRKESKDLKLLGVSRKKINKDISIGVKIPRDSGSVKSGQGRLATGPEPTVRRIVVQALMATPNCPWRLGKRIRKSKLT